MNDRNIKVIIDPRTAYRYESYYLKGITDLFGEISWDISPFKDLPYNTIAQQQQGTAMLFVINGKPIKIFIDTQDLANVDKDRYEWCDIYAKVNTLFGDTINYPKLMILGPHFGLNEHSLPYYLFLGIRNIAKTRGYSSISYKERLRGYIYPSMRRMPYESYLKDVQVKPNYIFHVSTLWYDDFTGSNTNRFRGEFLRACKSAGIETDGGLYYLESPYILKEYPEYEKYKVDYKDFIMHKRICMSEYVENTQASLLVFNTPSVCECHGWKLAEYLCMGKAIISTKLSREMPGEGLVHGGNIHFVENVSEIKDAIIKIKDDTDYRHKLEKNARVYFEKYLAPKSVIGRVVKECYSRGLV